MLEMFNGLSFELGLSLALALTFVLAYEFINGFHDTANAVATVIYTKAMPPHMAVIASGIFNCAGVLAGGLGVAYAIVHLLPVDLLLNVASAHGLVMVFALLTSAILWNLGTWYLGLPASSSHTLIGAILGVGLANALMNGVAISKGINVQKAVDIMLSLIVSPIVGLVLAGGLLLLMKKRFTSPKIHKTPEERQTWDGKKRPPFWTRFTLIASAMGVSFVHGSNDGQKGIGMIMLVLIGIVPGQFVVNMDSTSYQIGRTKDAAVHMGDFYQRNSQYLNQMIDLKKEPKTDIPQVFKCDTKNSLSSIATVSTLLGNIEQYTQLGVEKRREVRRLLLCIDDTAKKVSSLPGLPASEVADLNKLRKDLTLTTEYAPTWVIFAVALALGGGTMIGWRRIVQTVGEKIGQTGLTYSQGMAAQITTTLSIGLASLGGLPVSTTHVLSSAVAGTMLANRSGLQSGTVKNIVLAWVLTLPITMLLSASLFWLGTFIFVN
ncbi:inorganic phosphate transporter [Tolumonas lignilytica]|uniref:inorganic phosphate transporter n=1 Tax=Tolumonas lignilytica TaxID=1283284 RepID=UPI000464FC1B|nr:inorganic phosphate transporter [Tolumonas lignilytica]